MRLAGAVDIGGTNTKIGVVAEDGRILRHTTIPTKTGTTPVNLVDAIAGELRAMLDAVADERNPVAAVGIAVAGFLDREHTMMIANANLPALLDFQLRRAFEERFEVNCHLEVDSNASTVAEYRFGMGRGVSRLFGMTIGTGVGGGVINGGRLLRFTGECAGDVAHFVVDPNGRRCTCGARGCLEAMINSAALSERGGSRAPSEIIRAAKNGENAALIALDETGRLLGRGLASLSPTFAPERFVIGGGIAAAGNLLVDPARQSFDEHASDDFRGKMEIVASTFDGWEGMVGAASLALAPLD